MGEVTRDDAVKLLESRGVRRDKAVLYADALAEYREAAANILKNGSIVQHPRTGNPIENPYLVIRDRAAKRMQEMRGIDSEGLW